MLNGKTHLNCQTSDFLGVILPSSTFKWNSKILLTKVVAYVSLMKKIHLMVNPRPPACPIMYPWGTPRVPRGQTKTWQKQKTLPLEIVMYAILLKENHTMVIPRPPACPMMYHWGTPWTPLGCPGVKPKLGYDRIYH